jgi:chromosome segregation ATPase
LRVDPRTVRKYIKQGKLIAKAEGKGVEKTYLVSVDSLHELRGTRPDPRVNREEEPREAAGSASSADLVDLVRDLTTEVSRRTGEAAELRTRLELTEQAQSTLRESLERERERADQERQKAEEVQRDIERFIREREQAHEEARRLREEQEAERKRREQAEETERKRREQAEEKVSRLEVELESHIVAQGLSNMESEGGLGREGEPTSGTEETRSPWWRRWLFGG